MARLAILALQLGDPSTAVSMCRLTPDPIQRTIFIEECSSWHGDVVEFSELAKSFGDAHLRSTIALGVGSIPLNLVMEEHKQAWQPVWSEWYRNKADSGTHSAAAWALQKWQLTLPSILETRIPIDSRNWYVNTTGVTMLKVRDGNFLRRTTTVRSEDQRRILPDQKVVLTHDFFLSDREISLDQFKQFVDDPDYPTEDKPVTAAALMSRLERVTDTSRSRAHEEGAESGNPVYSVNWDDAVRFCNWMSRNEGLRPYYQRTGGKEMVNRAYDEWQPDSQADGYRLPTEAEWEYACRAGSVTQFSFGDEELLLDRYAVYGASRTEVCGTKLPNCWGFFDMHGNVFEWCQDGFQPYSTEKSLRDPIVSWQGTHSRVMRGGAFNYSVSRVQSDTRREGEPLHHYIGIPVGFRVARVLPN